MATQSSGGGTGGTGGDFFIASKLRGIPLVWGNQRQQAEVGDTTTTTTSSTTAPETIVVSAAGNGSKTTVDRLEAPASKATSSALAVAQQQLQARQVGRKPIQIGKRDANQPPASYNQLRGARIQGQNEILFKSGRVTASTASYMNAATRQQRPRTTTTTTTTRRPPATRRLLNTAGASNQRAGRPTTAARPATHQMGADATPAMAKLLLVNGRPVAQRPAPPPPPPPPSVPLATNELPTTTSTTTSTTSATSEIPQTEARQTTLTRAMQPLTTLPVSQRRGQQNLLSQRGYSSRPSMDGRPVASQFAGEKWVLFNRADGSLAAFEILVLLSNVMIVCAIVFVILLTWFKSIKRQTAKAPEQRNATPPQPAASDKMAGGGGGGGDGNLAFSQDVASNGRASKLSALSSGQLSGLTTTSGIGMGSTVTDQRQQQQQQPSMNSAGALPSDSMAAQPEAIGKLTGATAAADKHQLVGQTQKISSEFKTLGGNVANKAMAIVQPTENNSRPRQAELAEIGAKPPPPPPPPLLPSATKGEPVNKLHLKEELLSNTTGRSINRSVSDLSGSVAAAAVARPRGTVDDLEATGDRERVSKLEQLFNGGRPTPAKSDPPRMSETNGSGSKPARQQHQPQGRSSSASSLESIELPKNLVESIKKTAQGGGGPDDHDDEVPSPSPNLLLNETAKPAPADEPTERKPSDKREVAGQGPGASVQQHQAAKQQPPAKTNAGKTLVKREKSGDQLGKSGAQSAAESKPARDEAKAAQQTFSNPEERPENPMGRDTEAMGTTAAPPAAATAAEVKSHQVVVNKLDKRKTNLEIVDLRDESVAGKLRNTLGADKGGQSPSNQVDPTAWISMDGVAVVQPTGGGPAPSPATASTQLQQQQQQQKILGNISGPATAQPNGTAAQPMSPSEIIESRFHVDYKRRNKLGQQQQQQSPGSPAGDAARNTKDSIDSKTEENELNNIDNELELDNRLKNRKYFVYIVHDGHFTAKKECIARIELPPKRRVTLAELRQLIASSQDVSLSSLRRNRFKFVTETYRLLNENEDAVVLHQVYPTQGVFLKLNVAEQENPSYSYAKGGRTARLSSGSAAGAQGFAGGASSSLSKATIASRRRATSRARNAAGSDPSSALPAIEVNYAASGGAGYASGSAGSRPRATSVGRQPGDGANRRPSYPRSKSNVGPRRGNSGLQQAPGRGRTTSNTRLNNRSSDRLPSIGRSNQVEQPTVIIQQKKLSVARPQTQASSGAKQAPQTLTEAASDLGANVLSGAKRLLSSTFHL